MNFASWYLAFFFKRRRVLSEFFDGRILVPYGWLRFIKPPILISTRTLFRDCYTSSVLQTSPNSTPSYCILHTFVLTSHCSGSTGRVRFEIVVWNRSVVDIEFDSTASNKSCIVVILRGSSRIWCGVCSWKLHCCI